jgi:hypothetical protein
MRMSRNNELAVVNFSGIVPEQCHTHKEPTRHPHLMMKMIVEKKSFTMDQEV